MHGIAEAEANGNFWVLDKDGLITKARSVCVCGGGEGRQHGSKIGEVHTSRCRF